MAQIMYGKNVVKQILQDPSRILKIYLVNHDSSVEKTASNNRIPLEMVDKKTLSKITKSENHQGIAVKIKDYELFTVDQIIANQKGKYGCIIVLDELSDPHNLGAILRTADATGVNGVIFKKDNAVGLNATVAKVSAGAIDTVKCASVTNLTRTVQELKEKGYWIVGTDMDGQDYRDIKFDFNTVLIIGNEGKGISRLLQEQCDYIASIPMVGSISSLNASVSAGILMYEVYSKHFIR